MLPQHRKRPLVDRLVEDEERDLISRESTEVWVL